MPITPVAPPDLKRQYPHVENITDWRAQQTIRLLWDRIFDLEARLQAATATQGDLVEAVNAQEETLAVDEGRAGGGGGGAGDGGAGPPVTAHAPTHEPGGSDPLTDAAWTDLPNTFTEDQTIDGDLFVTGTITPLTAAQRANINALIGDPTGARTLMSSSFVSGLSLRHDEDLGLGRVACGNYDTQSYQPLLFEVEAFQVHTGVSPGTRQEHLRVHPSGGVTVGAPPDHATDPGTGVLRARGLDGTPLNADQLLSGTVADARLTGNVLRHPGGYPGGTTDYLRADGTFAAPPATSEGTTDLTVAVRVAMRM